MYRAGVSYAEFGKLNMKQIHYIAKAYAEKREEEFKQADLMAYIQGVYMIDALRCTVINFFGKDANFTYPERAYSLKGEEENLSEEEIERQRQRFIASLQTMEHNFNLNKQNKQGE